MERVTIVTGVSSGSHGPRMLILTGEGRSVPLLPHQTRGPHTGADFDWGRHNVGSANVAWHILAYIAGREVANLLYCDFVDDIVSKWEDPAFAICRQEVEEWLLGWISQNISRVTLLRDTKPEDN